MAVLTLVLLLVAFALLLATAFGVVNAHVQMLPLALALVVLAYLLPFFLSSGRLAVP